MPPAGGSSEGGEGGGGCDGDGDGDGVGGGDGNGDGDGDGETHDKQTSDDDAIQRNLRGAAAARNLGLYENLIASKIIKKSKQISYQKAKKTQA